jgi:ATP-dependent protease ClpP protease subunit
MGDNMKNFYWGSEEKEAPPSAKNEFIFKEPSYVEEVDNHVYFYGEVGRSEILRLNRVLRNKALDLHSAAVMQGRLPANIVLHINSYGGEIFSGFSAMDEITNCKVPVHTVIDGCCASAATFLSVVGKERFINKHGFMLIHQLSSVMWGKFEEFKDNMNNLERLMSSIKAVYNEHTKIPESKLEEILKHDLWFDAQQCLDYGMVDKIL